MKAIVEKDDEIKRMKTEHSKELNELRSLQTDNGDLNLRRLKKMYADLKKEKLKVEENNKKDIDALRKQKALLETELHTSCKESKNKEEERTTMLRIFDGMQEVLGKITSLTNTSAPDQPSKEYACEICEYDKNN